MSQLPGNEEFPDQDSRHLESVEQLAEGYTQQMRRGQQPSAVQLADQFPELSGDIDGLVKTLSVLEEASFRRRVAHTRASVVDSAGRRMRMLGGFRLIREISRGGMGIVYEATQESLNRRVAVKVLPPSPLLTEVERARFQREGNAIARLHHSNIVPVFGTGEERGVSYCVMQYIEGYSLDRVIRALRDRLGMPKIIARKNDTEPGSSETEQETLETITSDDLVPALFPMASAVNLLLGSDAAKIKKANSSTIPQDFWRNVARLGSDVADALHHAHQQGVLHRDIKPANLLFDCDGSIWVTDFGLAKLHDHESLTNKGSLLGTIRYAPREQFGGESDARTDVYSLGMTLYELSTLEPAFSASDQRELMRQVMHDTPRRPRLLKAGIPRDLETIILKAIASEREHRYQSASDLSVDLRNFVEDRPVIARRQTAPQLAWRWCRRHRLETATAGFALAMLMLFSMTATLLYIREARRLRESIATATEARQSLDQLYDSYLPDWTTTSAVSAHGSISVSPESARLFEDLVAIYDRLSRRSNRGSEKSAVLESSQAMRRVGLIYHRLGGFEKAKRSYAQAGSQLADFDRGDPSPEIQLEYARTLNELGAVCWTERHIVEADHHHEHAMAILNAIPPDTNDRSESAVQSELARTLYLIGRRGRGLGGGVLKQPELESISNADDGPSPKGRSEEISRAVQIVETLMSSNPSSTEHHQLLALCLREQSDGLLADDGSPVDQSILKAIDTLEYLVKLYPEHPGYRYTLCATLQWVKVMEGQPDAAIDAAIKRFQRSVDIAEQLSLERPDEWIYIASQVEGHLQMSDVERKGGRLEKALISLGQAIDAANRLIEGYPDCDTFVYWVGRAHLKQGLLLRRTSQTEQALQSYGRAMKNLEPLLDKRPDPDWNRVILRNMSKVCSGRRIVFAELGRRDDAKAEKRMEEYYWERSTAHFQ